MRSSRFTSESLQHATSMALFDTFTKVGCGSTIQYFVVSSFQFSSTRLNNNTLHLSDHVSSSHSPYWRRYTLIKTFCMSPLKLPDAPMGTAYFHIIHPPPCFFQWALQMHFRENICTNGNISVIQGFWLLSIFLFLRSNVLTTDNSFLEGKRAASACPGAQSPIDNPARLLIKIYLRQLSVVVFTPTGSSRGFHICSNAHCHLIIYRLRA